MNKKLITLEEARRTIECNFKPTDLGYEESVLLEAYNRVLAEDVVSSLDIPPFNRSTMDGYAVKSEDSLRANEDEAVTLNVAGAVAVGEQPNFVLQKREAAEIVTGAVLPEGADAVIMMEDTQREDSQLQVYTQVAGGENVLAKGADIKNGATVLKRGTLIGAPEIGVLAALGRTSVRVQKIPVIAVLSTGGEVTELGKPLSPGRIYDTNGYSLSTAIMESGGKPVYFGVAADDHEALKKALQTALVSTDMVITSGGVSVGPKDYTAEIVNALGKPGVVVNGIAVKPGKPTTVAFIDDKPVFCLPGHPSAALLMFYLLARPLLQRLGGRPINGMKKVKAYTSRRMFSAKNRRTFVMVQLEFDLECRLIAEPVEGGASGAITTLANADGFVEIAENEDYVDRGIEVGVWLFRGTAGRA
jgi:molybdenum cofactor synthesis domain-containing protein